MITLELQFHWVFASLRFAVVALSPLYNPRNASKTTDPPVMAGAMEAREIGV
jgi:hypothetical protein